MTGLTNSISIIPQPRVIFTSKTSKIRQSGECSRAHQMVLLKTSCCCHMKGIYVLSLVVRKPILRVSDQFQHKPGCTDVEDGRNLGFMK